MKQLTLSNAVLWLPAFTVRRANSGQVFGITGGTLQHWVSWGVKHQALLGHVVEYCGISIDLA